MRIMKDLQCQGNIFPWAKRKFIYFYYLNVFDNTYKNNQIMKWIIYLIGSKAKHEINFGFNPVKKKKRSHQRTEESDPSTRCEDYDYYIFFCQNEKKWNKIKFECYKCVCCVCRPIIVDDKASTFPLFRKEDDSANFRWL